MIEKLKAVYWNWQYIDEYNQRGWGAFWEALKFWWQHRPRLAKCAGCETMIWKNGDDTQYCSEGCAYFCPDQWVSSPEDEIPF